MTTQRIANALLGILEIGKRDTTNPKYDPHYNEARAALYEASQPLGIHEANILSGGKSAMASGPAGTPLAVMADTMFVRLSAEVQGILHEAFSNGETVMNVQRKLHQCGYRVPGDSLNRIRTVYANILGSCDTEPEPLTLDKFIELTGLVIKEQDGSVSVGYKEDCDISEYVTLAIEAINNHFSR